MDSADYDAVVDLTAITDEAFTAIWRARTGERLRCRECRAPLHAKRIQATGFRFFSHSPDGPPCSSTGESARHLGLKGLFAAAFRSAGWQADLEVAGDDWRADVLVLGPQGQRVAVEVQLATLTLDAAYDRMRRHRAAGVTTLWVLCDKRPRWARQLSTVLVDTNDLVIDTVLQDRALCGVRPTVARPATIDLFAARWAEGRLTPVQDSEDLQLEIYGNLSDTQYFQLDRCVDTYVASVRAENERELERIKRAAEERLRVDALAKRTRLPVENALAASLVAFQAWFCAQTRWKCWFGRSADRDPVIATYEREWSEDRGVLILIGAFSPKYVVALAEPHQASPKLDVRVAAWTTGVDPLVDTTGFRVVYTPDSVLDLADIPRDRLKPYWPKRRW